MFSHKIVGASIFLIILGKIGTYVCFFKFYVSFSNTVIGSAAVAAASAVADTGAELNDLTVDFSESLDASTLTKVNYGNFLTRLRNKLGLLPGASLISGTVALPIQTEPQPLRWFHLTLRGQGSKQTTIRFRGDNLYFVGYLMQNSVKWIELGRQGDKHYITETGTTFTGFRGNYDELKAKAGIASLDQVSLTKQTLNDAIAVLAESTDYQKRAKAVIVVVQMVSEACRFLQISEHLATNIGNTNNFLYRWMVPLETNWETYSTMVLLAHNFPTCNVYKPQTINGEVLSTADDLRKILGVMLRSSNSEENPCPKYGEDDDELRPKYVEPAVT